MKIPAAKFIILLALLGGGGICAFALGTPAQTPPAQAPAPADSPQTPAQVPEAGVAPLPEPEAAQIPAQTPPVHPPAPEAAETAERAETSRVAASRRDEFRRRREARIAARRESDDAGQPAEGRAGRERRRPPFNPNFAGARPSSFRDDMPPRRGEPASQNAGNSAENAAAQAPASSSEILQLLVSKNPFAQSSGKAAEQNSEGVLLRSAVMVDGRWSFSVSDKSGKSYWLNLGEVLENAPCKIDSFDDRTMTAKATVAGRQIDLALETRAANGNSRRVELVDAIRPRRMIAPHERAKVWSQYATDEQREAANRVWQTARAQGRNYLNREDRRKIFEIERTIQIPENAQGGGAPMPPQPQQR